MHLHPRKNFNLVLDTATRCLRFAGLKQLWSLIAAIVLALWENHEIRASRRQSPDSFILKLPPELILSITDFLAPHSQALLSRSCRTLKAVMGHMPVEALPHSERLQYFTVLSAKVADKWVCEQCATVHRADRHDTPSTPKNRYCRYPYALPNRIYWHSSCTLFHRHVQLALKYTRLGERKNQKHLKKLLAPFYDGFYTDVECCEVLITSFAVLPKIVNGRYLQLSVYTYQEDTQPITLDTIGWLVICKHQAFGMLRWWPTLDAIARRRVALLEPYELTYTLACVVRLAFEVPGTELSGACEFCATDFSVRVTPETASLRVWQDFGGEGSPWNEDWRAHVEDDEQKWKVLAREHGGVRRAYEKSLLRKLMGQDRRRNIYLDVR